MKKCECGRAIPVRPNSTIQPKKCPICLNKQRLEKKPKERKKADEKTLAMKRADKWFSLYIRTYYSLYGVTSCYTCDKPLLIQDAVCGHFIKRRFNSVRYNVNNARPQCLKCNDEYIGGMQTEFGIRLQKEIGSDAVDNLKQLSLFDEPTTIDFYNEMAEKYKKLYNELK